MQCQISRTGFISFLTSWRTYQGHGLDKVKGKRLFRKRCSFFTTALRMKSMPWSGLCAPLAVTLTLLSDAPWSSATAVLLQRFELINFILLQGLHLCSFLHFKHPPCHLPLTPCLLSYSVGLSHPRSAVAYLSTLSLFHTAWLLWSQAGEFVNHCWPLGNKSKEKKQHAMNLPHTLL